MLDSVRTVTYRVADVAASKAALETCFGYRPVAEYETPVALAVAWNAAQVEGRHCCVLQPESGLPFYIRLIDGFDLGGYAPLKTFGWNSAELLVEDVNEVAAALAESPFEILGGPRDLMDNGAAIALQVSGPGQELFYLTEINGDRMQATYGVATCRVDRLFIVVLGADDHAATLDFYRELGAGTTRPRKFAIRVLAAAHGLDPMATKFGIAAACLNEQFRIEIDDYPASATRRVTPSGEIPAGLGIVSMTVENLDDCSLASDVHIGPNVAPYFGCRFSHLVGPNDEWIELLETPVVGWP